MRLHFWSFLLVAALGASFLSVPACHAQKILDKYVSVSVKNQSVSAILKLVEEQGRFKIGYNSDIISSDSIVGNFVRSGSVTQVLDALLTGKFQYKEKGDYIIIQRAAREKYYQIAGQVLDGETDKPVDYASVYSMQQLVSTLTDDAGAFKIRLRDRNFPITLSLSKVGYADTSIVINSEADTDLKMLIYPKAIDLDTLVITNANSSNFWLARLLVSSRLRAQSRNIGRFFVALPFQASLTPGLSTHGRMSSQIINKVSINIYGGYTAGVNGVEIGGLFNISKKDVRYVQLATTFNIVAGHLTGIQVAAIYNQVLDSLNGVQLTGVGGVIKGHLEGVQASFVFNSVLGSMSGAQLALGANVATGNVKGVQMSILGNVSQKNVKGLQLGVFNYAKRLKGVQVGFINLADSSSGYSIGFLNIVKKGSGSLSVHANELVPWNITWKSGSRKLYNILTVGSSLNSAHKAYVYGFGLGRQFILSDNLKLYTELEHLDVYLGDVKPQSVLYRFQAILDLKISKQFTLNAGPSFSLFSSGQKEFKTGYQSFSDKGFLRFNVNKYSNAWAGYQFGLSWNYKQ
ncbi:MAG: carboxypeptidase-like regulatory domain-containing protein [Dyadobacter sp.]|uniref:LA_2272 family surface repeat-containing protein n=1 Tax=Dyadobacter sp. TaxID=1914288 RepID=UPI003262F718